MTSLFTAKTHSGRFRLRWRGYDPEQVDEFLRQTTADRQRLEEGLAQLEAFMAGQGEERRREFERLTKLRAEVASCLETSIGALRTATERLSHGQVASGEKRQPSEVSKRPELAPQATTGRYHWDRLAWMSRGRAQALVASVFLLALVPATLFYRSSAREIPVEVPTTPAVATRSVPEDPETAAVVADQTEGLVLTLTARRPCWIRTRIDGGQPLERLLKTDETIMLRATEEAFLRVGDASALSMLINNRLAKPLGTSGQVVTVRITLSNYLSLLAEGSAP